MLLKVTLSPESTTFEKGNVKTLYANIYVEWRYDKKFEMKLNIAVNTTAIVCLTYASNKDVSIIDAAIFLSPSCFCITIIINTS